MNRNEFINHFSNLLLEFRKNNDLKQFFARLHREYLDIPNSDEIVISQFNGIGDNILLSSFIRNVRNNNPDKKITLICNKAKYDLFEYCPYIDSIVTIDIDKPSYADCMEIIFNCIKEHFWYYKFGLSLAPQWNRPNYMAMLINYLLYANKSVGYSVNAYQSYYDNHIDYYNDPLNYDTFFTDCLYTPYNVIHNIARKKYLLEYLNYSLDDMHLEAWLSAADEAYANNILKDINTDTKLIILGLGGIEKSKQYPPDLLVSALISIHVDNPNIKFLLLGDSNDIVAAEYISERVACINLINATTLRQSIALIKRCSMYIGNDTSLSHMASIFNLPEIVIFMEAKDKQNDVPGHLSSIQQFKPYTDKLVIIQPQESLDICRDAHIHGGCCYNYPHCITQINPLEIINAFNKLKQYI